METFTVLDVATGNSKPNLGYYRIQTAAAVIKYLRFSLKDWKFDPHGRKLDFTAIPTGSWNIGHLAVASATGKYLLVSTASEVLQQATCVWYPDRVDYLALQHDEAQTHSLHCAGELHAAVYPGHLGAEKIVAVWEWFPDDVYPIDISAEIYSRITGHDIGPRFVAHITENNNRVCGYMTEYSEARHADIGDLAACKEVLSRLHSLSISYGTLHQWSFLVTKDRVLLHCFANACITDDRSVLDAEIASLEQALQSGPRALSLESQELNDKLNQISARDGGLHEDLVQQAFCEGKITISEAEHKEMLQSTS
jgi:hypothetical protein